MRKLFGIFFSVVLLAVVGQSHADCTVKEIVGMVRGGAGNSIIEDKCDNEVADAPRCTFTQALQLSRAKRSVVAVNDVCGFCERPRCDVGMNACPLQTSQLQGAREGDGCHCFTPMGPVFGTLSCNN
jgi:hypothetical protein